jgi:hypothetical protein
MAEQRSAIPSDQFWECGLCRHPTIQADLVAMSYTAHPGKALQVDICRQCRKTYSRVLHVPLKKTAGHEKSGQPRTPTDKPSSRKRRCVSCGVKLKSKLKVLPFKSSKDATPLMVAMCQECRRRNSRNAIAAPPTRGVLTGLFRITKVVSGGLPGLGKHR